MLKEFGEKLFHIRKPKVNKNNAEETQNIPENWPKKLRTIWHEEGTTAKIRADVTTKFLKEEPATAIDNVMLAECLRHELALRAVGQSSNLTRNEKDEFTARILGYSAINLMSRAAFLMAGSTEQPSTEALKQYLEAAQDAAQTINDLYDKFGGLTETNVRRTVPRPIRLMHLALEN